MVLICCAVAPVWVLVVTPSERCNAAQQVLYMRWLMEGTTELVPGPPMAVLQMRSDLRSLWSGHSSRMLMQPWGGLLPQVLAVPVTAEKILICSCPALYTHREVRPVKLIFSTKPAFPRTKPNLRGSPLG